jgi:hypothetical protein
LLPRFEALFELVTLAVLRSAPGCLAIASPVMPALASRLSVPRAQRIGRVAVQFLGSWILALTAHSDVLQEFDGGNGRIGIHGRGGASLLDPLGSNRSHGCVRLADSAIDWLVHTIGPSQLPGTPVRID